MAAAGLLLPTLAAGSNALGRGHKIRTSVNIDINRRSRVQCKIPPSPILSTSAANEKGVKKGELCYINILP